MQNKTIQFKKEMTMTDRKIQTDNVGKAIELSVKQAGESANYLKFDLMSPDTIGKLYVKKGLEPKAITLNLSYE